MIRSTSPSRQRELWFDRPTCDCFARVVSEPADLDIQWQAALSAALLPGETIRCLIQVPFQGKLKPAKGALLKHRLPWEFTPDCLVVLTGQRLVLIRGSETDPFMPAISIAVDSIVSLQCGTVLLFSWMNVRWAESGSLRGENILFNAVGEPIFTRLVALIRQDLHPEAEHWGAAPNQNREMLRDLPYKFSNLLPARTLLPGEPVLQMLYRPVRWTGAPKIFRRMSASQAVLVLSPAAVLLAEEDLAAGESHYGFISTILPLRSIRQAGVRMEPGCASLILSLEWLGAQDQVRVDFAPEALEKLEAFAAQLMDKR